MIKSKKISIMLSFMIFFLILNLFVLNISSKGGMLIILLVFLLIALSTTKLRNDNFYNKNNLVITMALIGLLQVGLFYLSGAITGFVENAVILNSRNIIKLLIPFLLSITVVEILRYLLATYYKEDKTVNILSYILFVLVDISLFHYNPNFAYLESTLEFLGLTLFPSLVSNAVFNKIVVDYGFKPILVYRLIIVLSYYIFPIIPDMYILFRTIFKILIPIGIQIFMMYLYDRTEFEEIFIKKEKVNIITILLLIVIVATTALISCKFKYGAVTVATGSMTGTIDIGDVIIYEQYNKQKLKENDIIIFNKDKRKTVHRIIEVGRFNNENVYVTKGDYNKNKDIGYVYEKDIKGIVKTKIKYIGYPSVLIRKTFK